jgi:ADP-ribose pyrophosphatase
MKQPPLSDRPAEIEVFERDLIAQGYFRYERVIWGRANAPHPAAHDILRGGKAVAVLPIDLGRGEVVLIRQVRPAAQLANGKGDLVEIVAGRVEPGEELAETARRECVEEIGVAPGKLVELFTFLTTPGLTDEEITLFLGVVDASGVPERAGAAHEREETRPLRVPFDEAFAALAAGTLRNGPMLLALQWLALNRNRLEAVIRAGAKG